jgi:hypothetical protein
LVVVCEDVCGELVGYEGVGFSKVICEGFGVLDGESRRGGEEEEGQRLPFIPSRW